MEIHRWASVPVMAASAALLLTTSALVGVVTAPGATANGAVSGQPTYAVVGQLSGCEGPRGMTVVRNGTSDDTVFVACAGDGAIAVIPDVNTSGSLSTIDVGGSDVVELSSRQDAGARASTADDTIYTYNYDDSSIGVIPAGVSSGGPYDDSIYFGGMAWALTVSRDDTAYLSFDDTGAWEADDTIGVIGPGTTSGQVDDSFPAGAETFGLAAYDDTLYSFTIDAAEVRAMSGLGMTSRTWDDSVETPDLDPIGLGFHMLATSDSRLFALLATVSTDDSQIVAFDPVALSLEDTVSLSIDPVDLATEPSGMIVVTSPTGAVELVSGSTMVSAGLVQLPGTAPEVKGSQAITRSGVAYVGDWNHDLVYRLAKVTPGLSTSSGAPGTSVTLNLDPAAPGLIVDDTTVESVTFGSQTVTRASMTKTNNSYSFAAPAGTGVVPVTVNFHGNSASDLGDWTYPTQPSPEPTPVAPSPPTAPREVSALAQDQAATVSWTAPESAGSFPITEYEVTSTPGSHSCLAAAPTLTCQVTGLTNGVSYTFTVRALNGAGWGPYSSTSNAVTPVGPEPPARPTITITGTRGEVRGTTGVLVQGTSTGLAMGAILRPWVRFPGATSYSEGIAEVLVDQSGGFTWQRRTAKRTYVVMRSADGFVVSNRIVIPAA